MEPYCTNRRRNTSSNPLKLKDWEKPRMKFAEK